MTHLRNFVLSLFLSLCGFAAPAVADNYGTGQVFTMTNAAGGNAILIFNHHPQQGLVGAGSVATGGDGTGAGLGNQGGVILSKHHRWLYAVNAGSDSVSVFRVRKGGLTLIDTIPSDGSQPVSLTRHDNLLYVLNAGSDSIAGFTVNGDGTLSPLAGSVQGLSGGGTGPAQISFTPWGDALVVTEKATNRITTFLVDEDGLPGPAVVNDSAGPTPFGFDFDRYGHLLVSEAAGGAPDASSLSSYEIQEDGTLVVLASAVPTTETASRRRAESPSARRTIPSGAGQPPTMWTSGPCAEIFSPSQKLKDTMIADAESPIRRAARGTANAATAASKGASGIRIKRRSAVTVDLRGRRHPPHHRSGR